MSERRKQPEPADKNGDDAPAGSDRRPMFAFSEAPGLWGAQHDEDEHD
jgi:hypothetical protein